MDAGSCHNDLICRITMKFSGKLSGFNRNLRREVEQPDARITEGCIHPLINRAMKRQLPDFDQQLPSMKKR